MDLMSIVTMKEPARDLFLAVIGEKEIPIPPLEDEETKKQCESDIAFMEQRIFDTECESERDTFLLAIPIFNQAIAGGNFTLRQLCAFYDLVQAIRLQREALKNGYVITDEGMVKQKNKNDE